MRPPVRGLSSLGSRDLFPGYPVSVATHIGPIPSDFGNTGDILALSLGHTVSAFCSDPSAAILKLSAPPYLPPEPTGPLIPSTPYTK